MAKAKVFGANDFSTQVTVRRDPKVEGWVCFYFFFLFLGPLLYFFRRAGFESRRWKDSNM
jgi:hypothetical protein